MKAHSFIEKILFKLIFIAVIGIVVLTACFLYVLFADKNSQCVLERDVVCNYGNDNRILVSKNYNGTWYSFVDISTNYQDENIIDYKITNFGLFNSKLYLNSSDGLYIYNDEPFKLVYISFNQSDDCLSKIKKHYGKENLMIIEDIDNLESDDKMQAIKLLNLLENKNLFNFYLNSMCNRMENNF